VGQSGAGPHIVVVGASHAGLAAAVALRAEGFTGRLTMIGAERHLPYDRVPLAKGLLAGETTPDQVVFPAARSADVTWRLGRRATGLDLAGRAVALDDGTTVGFDGLVIATGARPRSLPGGMSGGAARQGIFRLRTLDDATGLAAALDAAPRRVVVIGAGFVGAEVAAACRARGLPVTVVELATTPLTRVLGEPIGTVLADIHRDHGVDLRLGVRVRELRDREALLSDGSTVVADVIVVGVGARPDTDWLAGSGLTLDDGVVCDAALRAAPGVVAAGDVARWPSPRYGSIRLEHWDNAGQQGAVAARSLLAGLRGQAGPVFDPVPYFWSDQYDRKLQMVGVARPGDELRVVAGSLVEGRFTAVYGRAGRVVAVIGMNQPARVMRMRQLAADNAPVPDAAEPATSVC
jgi:3-phenylpropionate/trans-cinnamate dioxygenase ferredoxin reductase component